MLGVSCILDKRIYPGGDVLIYDLPIPAVYTSSGVMYQLKRINYSSGNFKYTGGLINDCSKVHVR